MNSIDDAVKAIAGSFDHCVIHMVELASHAQASEFLTPLPFVTPYKRFLSRKKKLKYAPNIRVRIIEFSRDAPLLIIGGQLSVAENEAVLEHAKRSKIHLNTIANGNHAPLEMPSWLDFLAAYDKHIDKHGRLADVGRFGDLWAVVFVVKGKPKAIFGITIESVARMTAYHINNKSGWTKVITGKPDKGLPGATLCIKKNGRKVYLEWFSDPTNTIGNETTDTVGNVDVDTLERSGACGIEFPKKISLISIERIKRP